MNVLLSGLLLRQMSTDAELSQYSVIVIDEVIKLFSDKCAYVA